MAHYAQTVFVETVKKEFPDAFHVDGMVLEVGSLDINGSVRPLFKSLQYVGVDLGEGPGVDLVWSGDELEKVFAPQVFETSISTECFEHNRGWIKTLQNMLVMSKKYVIFTCAAPGRPEHGTVNSDINSSPYTAYSGYYANVGIQDVLESGIPELNDYTYVLFENMTDSDLYFFASREPVDLNPLVESLCDVFKNQDVKVVQR